MDLSVSVEASLVCFRWDLKQNTLILIRIVVVSWISMIKEFPTRITKMCFASTNHMITCFGRKKQESEMFDFVICLTHDESDLWLDLMKIQMYIQEIFQRHFCKKDRFWLFVHSPKTGRQPVHSKSSIPDTVCSSAENAKELYMTHKKHIYKLDRRNRDAIRKCQQCRDSLVEGRT